LRDENKYHLTASLTDSHTTYQKSLSFIPSLCRWYIVAGGDAKSTEKEFPFYPGTSDLEFELQLVNNSAPMCAQENRFYDKFEGLSYVFILKNSIHHLTELPLMSYHFTSDKITVKMTKTQQLKLPTSIQIQLLLTVHMTSSIFSPLLQSQKPVF